MFDSIKEFFSQLKEAFKKIPPNKRVVIFVTSGLVMASLLYLLLWAQKSEFIPLFSNLNLEDTNVIVEKLKNRNIPYKLNNGGGTILVPSNRVYDLRLEFAGEGIPETGGVGFEIFDKTTFGITEFVQKLNYLRALQGELARTISRLSEIDQAKVHVVLPEKALFKEDQEKTTASVILKFKKSKNLNRNQIQGIVHLIASSVEGLDSSNITIIDIHGNILAGGEDSDPISMLTSSQLNYKKNFQNNLAKGVESILEPVVGKGKVIVKISADLNFQQEERVEETFDPDSQVIRSEQKSEDKSVGLTPPSGVPGVQSNKLDAVKESTGEASPPKSSHLNQTKNYDINKITRKIITPLGVVNRLSVAVMLDGAYSKKSDENGDREYIPWTKEEMKTYEEIVKSAVGFDVERGDVVKVSNVPFKISDLSYELKSMESDANQYFWLNVIKYTLSAGVLILFVFYVLKPLIQGATSMQKHLLTFEEPKTISQLEDMIKMVEEEDKVEVKKDYRGKVPEIIQNNPKKAAELIRKWMTSRNVAK